MSRLLHHFFLATGAVLIATAPAKAGLFDFLFGAQPAPRYQSAPTQAYPGSYEDGARASAARKAEDAARRAASERRAAEQAARDRETIQRLREVALTQGPKAAFMMDPTLRSGDIVVTPSGIEVFEGARGGGRVHAANEFRPLSRSNLRNRADLALLQSISGLNAPETAAPVVAEIRPLTINATKKVAARKPAPAKTADAKPAFIRASASGL